MWKWSDSHLVITKKSFVTPCTMYFRFLWPWNSLWARNTRVGCPFPFSGWSSWCGDRTCVSFIAGRFLTIWGTREDGLEVEICVFTYQFSSQEFLFLSLLRWAREECYLWWAGLTFRQKKKKKSVEWGNQNNWGFAMAKPYGFHLRPW